MQLLPISTNRTARDIGAAAKTRLRESPYFFLRTIDCEFRDGTLTLLGYVPYPQLKQIAESIVSRVDGVQHIVNRLEVRDPTRVPLGAPAVRNAG